MLTRIEGGMFREGDLAAVESVADVLRIFHDILVDEIPSKATLREDHPDMIEPYAKALYDGESDESHRNEVRRIIDEVGRIREVLDSGLYESLPRTVIHGDFHTGNVGFNRSTVSAVYDFDYLSRQPRIRDISDAMIFFASRRNAAFDPDSIVSLTQPFLPEPKTSTVLVHRYQQGARLTDGEWAALPWVMKSRWLQMRLRGGRKIEATKRYQFITDRIFDVIRWIDVEGAAFFESVMERARRSG